MSRRTPPFPEYDKWTTARFWQFVRSALRQAWTKWPPKHEAMKQAQLPYQGKQKNRKYSYRCASCKKTFKGTEVQVDHIEGAGSLNDYHELPGFVQRLFVSVDKLQVLCKACHRRKTKDERR